MKRGQGAFEYILLLAGVLLIVVLAIIILRGTLTGNQEPAKAQCLAGIAKAGVCYLPDGSWNSTSIAYSAADYGLDAVKCLNDNTGALRGTSWDVVGNDNQFYCGPRPA
ncbi:MAG: class III signal peptide-containing protein [Candidatus Micrarchaeota archaeon]